MEWLQFVRTEKRRGEGSVQLAWHSFLFSRANKFSELCHGASEKREKFSAALQGGGLLAGCPRGPASSAGVNYAEVGRFVNG